MTESSRLARIFWCVNARHGLNENDRLFFNFAKHLNVEVQLVFTKADEVEQLILFERIKAITHVFKAYRDVISPIVNITSAETGFGLHELRMSVRQAALESPQRTIKTKAGRIEYLLEEDYDQFEKDTFRLLIQRDNNILFKQNKLEFKIKNENE